MKYLVYWKAVSKETGRALAAGSMSVEAYNRYDAETKALIELRRHPPVQTNEDVEFIVSA